MIFTDIVFYACFLIPSVILYYTLGHAYKAWVLTASGASFFLYFSALHFGGGWSALLIFVLAYECLFARLYEKGSRWCLFGVGQALLILIFFKYLVWLVKVWNEVPLLFPLPELSIFSKLLIPLGISFFTFEFIHYAVDCYVGSVNTRRFREYFAFIFFFPTLASGPIKRYHKFERELRRSRLVPANISQGITRILIGLVKKNALADTCSLWAQKLDSDAIFSASGPTLCLWVLIYGWKIYFDFSGYSDIAIGSAKLFGIEVPENFNLPYLSRNISEFWRRWHMSLMLWLEHYVFTPILYGRWRFFSPKHFSTMRRVYLSVFLVFIISGLWHGAGYHFLLWGAYHGILVVSFLALQPLLVSHGWNIPAPVSVSVTYVCVNLGYPMFALKLPQALFVYQRILGLA